MSTIEIAIAVVVGLTLLEVAALVLLPKTRSLRVAETLTARVDAVFALVSDVSRAGDWIPGCVTGERLSTKDGPARRQRVTYVNGRTAEQQVTTWIVNQQYGWKETPKEGPLAESRVVLTLTERNGVTEVEILGEWTARSLLTKLFVNFGQLAIARRTFAGMQANIRKHF